MSAINKNQNSEEKKVPTLITIGMMRGVPQKWNLAANFNIFLNQVDKAGEKNVNIFITPECWLDGYAAADKGNSTREKLLKLAGQELNKSKYLKQVSEKAKKHQLYILFGFSLIQGEKLYNSAGLWGPKGELIGIYHKTHLQSHDLQYDPGLDLPVFATKWGPVGIMICADRRWPEVARTLRLKGARLILNPTYGMHHDKNQMWMQTRGYENQCFIPFTHPQQSLLVSPSGNVVIKEEGDAPGLTVATIDLNEARDDNHLLDRRPELYQIITEPKK